MHKHVALYLVLMANDDYGLWHACVCVSCIAMQRAQKRKDWHTRQTDPIFKKLSQEFRPLNPPLPPYDTVAAAEEVLLLPCRGDGGLRADGIVKCTGIADSSMTMKSVDISVVIDEKVLLAWQELFENRSS